MRVTLAILACVAVLALLAQVIRSPAPPPSFFDRTSTELQSLLCVARAGSLVPLDQERDSMSRSQSWQITVPGSWDDYVRHAKAGLTPRMKVLVSSDNLLVLRETLPGDLLTLEITRLESNEEQTVVHARFRGEAW